MRVAVRLARSGVEVVLYDKETAPLGCASRWNEGKIHLGYLYGADGSLATARHILPGSLRFADLLGEVIGTDPRQRATTSDDTFLVHRGSVVPLESLEALYPRIDALVREHPDASHYLADVSGATHRRMTANEVAEITTAPEIVGGFKVPERSVDTRWVADRLVAAITAEPGIELRLGVTVKRAEPVDLPGGQWRVRAAEDAPSEPFDYVVNALWEGRLAVDASSGIVPPPGWSHRFRLCLFARTKEILDVPSTLISVGPFGDVKNYGGRDFYMSWYPVGLVARGNDVAPPPAPHLDAAGKAEFVARVREHLTRLMPATGAIFEQAEQMEVGGGYVFAQESGDIGDPSATIHRRNRFGIERNGGYISVDTGKYSTAPLFAERVAAMIVGG